MRGTPVQTTAGLAWAFPTSDAQRIPIFFAVWQWRTDKILASGLNCQPEQAMPDCLALANSQAGVGAVPRGAA